MNQDYPRVLPRDLFNESKLIKCIGRLVLLLHDGFSLNGLRFDHDGDPFLISLTDDGYLTISNVFFTLNNNLLFFKSLYNSKNNYCLFCEHNYNEYLVLNEDGNYTDEFKDFCNTL